MGLGGVISNLLSLSAKLLPAVSESAQASSSSSSPPLDNHKIEAELKALMRMLERIKATLYDAEGREIMDQSVKLWLKELKQVAYDAEDVLDEYNYEILRAQVEAKNASQPDSRKRKQIQIPDGMSDQIKDIKDKFDEIEKHRIALRLSDEDGPRRFNSELRMAPTGHSVRDSNIFGREEEKKELITMLSSDCDDGEVVHVVTIVGPGGLGKTTLAQLVYKDQRREKRFNKFGWICVTEDFNVQRLMRETIESITGSTCDLQNLSALQMKISEEIRGKRILLVLDDMWNEDRSQWELLSEPFTSAKEAKILVTTRNESVAIIMQTVPSFKLDYMSKEHSWRLFKHYAFGEVNQNEDSKFIKIGEKILKKCGNLPLAIKSVACLLRQELEEEKWIDILESEIWDPENKVHDEIFKPLQISYARLPSNLKPCFLYCSMFPKDELLPLDLLVQLWTAQGYIQSTRKNNSKKIGREYAKQLWERSFLEGSEGEKEFHLANSFKLHDLVHDLARLNSNGEYSIDAGDVPKFPSKLYHMHIRNEEILKLPSIEVSALRTLIISINTWVQERESFHFDFSKAHKLRALILEEHEFTSVIWDSDFFSFIGNFKHLRHLSLWRWPVPSNLHSLCFLRTLSIQGHDIEELPESIGNLVSLEELVIYNCGELQELPSQMGRLTNIQTLKIFNTGISSLPPSLNKIIGNIQELHVRLQCTTIGWLEDFVEMKGTLIIENQGGIDRLDDEECANLARMHSLECLMLFYNSEGTYFDEYVNCEELFSFYTKGNIQLQLELYNKKNLTLNDEDQVSVMARLQPHPNLRELHVHGYPGITFPEWMRDTTSCASLERIAIHQCENLASLSFGGLCKLKYLEIEECNKLQFLGANSLPLQLQELSVYYCEGLISLPGIKKLKSLVKLTIRGCIELQAFMMDADEQPSDELTPHINESLHQNSLLGLRNLISLRSLKICGCYALQALVDEPRPIEESCEVDIIACPWLWDWCSHHSIRYKDF